jgi:hypothetical protein
MWNAFIEIIGEFFMTLFTLSTSEEDRGGKRVSKIAGYVVLGSFLFLIIAAIYNNL